MWDRNAKDMTSCTDLACCPAVKIPDKPNSNYAGYTVIIDIYS